MPLVPVTTYGAAWSPSTNKGRVFISIGGGAATPVPVENAEEFVIMLAMMSKSGVQFDSQTREIQTPMRPVGT